jgi:hypothetical protein
MYGNVVKAKNEFNKEFMIQSDNITLLFYKKLVRVRGIIPNQM